MEQVTLLSERLTLRPARIDDADALFDIYSRPEAMAYWSTPPHSTRQITREWLQALIDNTDTCGFDLIAEYQGRIIGKGGLYRPPEFGYMIHPDFWGRGLGQEMAITILHHAFTAYDLREVTADVDPGNLASLRLLNKLGFQITGQAQKTFQIDGAWKDSVYLALSRACWNDRC
jgi:RimJ/RimL family protein N-acetyltransferase